MKYWLPVFLLLSLPALAQNAIFLGPAAAGANNGSSCTNAYIVTWLNVSAHYSPSPSGTSTYGPGTTLHFCGGTYSAANATSNYLVFQGSGTSGNPITTVCDAAATFTAPSWAGDVINLAGNNYLTLNGTNCTITASANGTSLAHQQDGGIGIGSSSPVSHVIIENWTISNLYVHACSGSSPTFSNPCPTVNDNSGGGNTSGIQIWEGTNDTISFNTISNVHWGIVDYYGGNASNSTNILVFNNTISNMDHGIIFGDQGSNSTLTSSNCSSAIYNNDLSNMQNWDASGGGFHHDAIHTWANNAPGSNYQGLCIYSNYVHGNMGFYPSGMISLESLGNAAYVFNNLIGNLTNNSYCADGALTHFTGSGSNSSGLVLVNNTVDPGTTPCSVGGSGTANSGSDVGITQASGTIFKDNLLLSNATTYVHSGSGTISAADYNVYATPAGSNPFFGTCGSGVSFATWQGSCGFDTHGKQAAVTINANYTLPIGSAAIGAGVNLTSLGITALDTGAPQTFGVNGSCGTGCITRPSSGVWDAGAFPFQAPPAPQSGLFSAGFNQSNSTWCPWDGNNVAAQIFGYRIWDDGQKWGQIQTTNSAPNFAGMDNAINTRARGNNTQSGENIPIGSSCPGTPMSVIYTFGDTPQWASAGAIAANNCASPSTQYSCTKPASLNNDGTGTDVEFATIVADTVARYAGKITYYEVWNEADSPNFWCWNDAAACGGSGSSANPVNNANVASLKNLVRMAWDLKNIVACGDPAAKVLSPSFHVGTALTWFHNYNITSISAPAGVSGVNGVPVGCNWNAATVTGAQTYDYVNVHARGTSAAYPTAAGNWNPAAQITAYNNTVTECSNDSLPNCPATIFNDEFGYNSSTEGGGNTDGYSAYVAQAYIFSWSLGITQSYWYQWDTATIGLNGAVQGTAYDTVAGWLNGATLTSACALSGALYECGLTKGGITELIVWDTSKYAQPCCTAPANQVYGSAYTNYIDLTGASFPTTGGNGTAPTGWKPILLQQNGTPPPGADDLYCPAGTPTWGSTDGPATLPTACYRTASANTPAPGAVVNVSTAGQLTTALAAAACGQQITLAAGATFSGNFTVPKLVCAANNYLWIVTSGLSSLPSEGARYTTTYNGTSLTLPQFGPCYAGVTSLAGRPAFNCPGTPGTYTAKIVTPGANPALTFTAGTSGVRVIGLEITRTAATGFVGVLVAIGNIGIDHIIFDRVWAHGDNNQDETNGFVKESAASYMAVVDSYMNDFYCISGIGACTDAHPIGGGVNSLNSTTETVLKAVNNFIEGAAQSILFGGGAANTTPSNHEYRLNVMFKPLTWNPSDPSYNGGVSGHAYIVKNCFELKNAQLVLFEGNQCINNWGGFSQNGASLVITPKNQSGSLCPLCKVTNVTLRYSTINTAASVGEFSMVLDGGGIPAAAGNSWSIHDLVADNLLYSTCNSCGTGTSTFQAIEYYGITNPAQAEFSVTFNHNTAVYASTAGTLFASLGLSGALSTSGGGMNNILFTNNLTTSGSQGTQNSTGGSQPLNCANSVSPGTNMINACWIPSAVTGNCFVNNGTVAWPIGNITSVASYTVVFTSYNNGDNGNYTVASGACKGAATDGTDTGANIAGVASVIAGNAAPALQPSPPAGTVAVTVTGSGTVTSTPAGISCPGTCSAMFAAGTILTFTETPNAGNNFAGWGGQCAGTGVCTFNADSATLSVTATFAPVASNTVTVTISPSGGGTVTSAPAGISCPGTCSATFTNGTPITLSETPIGGFTFGTWSGVCSGATCSFTMGSSPVAATATFTAPPPGTPAGVIVVMGSLLTQGVTLVNH